jgi:hypothetical protein
MQAKIRITCGGCDQVLATGVIIDTSSLPEDIASKIKTPVLKHRQQCPAYRQTEGEGK